ncbi:MAG: type II toxin-antitoxin system PemK/MazF family toxin [Candidatus Omnitrophica bacterium]|nr:type II toxin-antitoxin system PemK/MazF family toxin [Candidatus Omnitrophota bacterium]
MVSPARGKVVLVPFPFSDLSSSKVRPSLVLAHAGGDDWLLCQITSSAYADPHAVQIDKTDFVEGSLHRTSYIRPGKVFTASRSLIVGEAGAIGDEIHKNIIQKVVNILLG